MEVSVDPYLQFCMNLRGKTFTEGNQKRKIIDVNYDEKYGEMVATVAKVLQKRISTIENFQSLSEILNSSSGEPWLSEEIVSEVNKINANASAKFSLLSFASEPLGDSFSTPGSTGNSDGSPNSDENILCQDSGSKHLKCSFLKQTQTLKKDA